MNPFATRAAHMTADEFLAWPGDGSGRRSQLVDGDVLTMAPASRIHGAIQANLAFLLVRAVRETAAALQVITEAAVVPALNAADNVRVPDLVVAPRWGARGDQVVADPLLVIEILSPGNAAMTRDNVRAYATLASVQEIVVVHSSRVAAEVYRRRTPDQWADGPDSVEPGARLQLRSVGLACCIDEVYANTWLARA